MVDETAWNQESLFKDMDEEPQEPSEDRFVEIEYVTDYQSSRANWSLFFGIISIVLSFPLGIIFGIVSKTLVSKYMEHGGEYAGPVKGASVTSSIGITLFVVNTIIFIIRMLILFCN